MLVYIEYISRRPGVSLEAFHEVAGRGQTAWAGEYGDDQLVLNVGRTWRMGPEPEYVAVWYNAAAGLERIAEWERIFTSGEAAQFEEPFKLAARIDAAGCYEPLLDPVPGDGGPYYAEFFEPAAGASRDEVQVLLRRAPRPGRARAQPAGRAHRPARARPSGPGRLDTPLVRRSGDDRP